MPSTAKAQKWAGTRSGRDGLLAVAAAAAVLGGTLALLSHGGIGPPGVRPGELTWRTGLLAAGSSLPILAWRRAPLGVLAATAGASTLLAGAGSSLGLPLGPTVALYLLAQSRDEQHPWTPRTTLAVIGLFAGYLGATAAAQGGFPASELSHTGLAWAAAWFAGERTRLGREHLTELGDRALDAERAAEQDRRLAVAEERARIARDLHDSAGHAINVIVVRAGAARMRHEDDPQRSRAALEAIEEIARQTAAEIDQIVGTLRDERGEDEGVDAPPGLASLDTLVAHHAATGLDVTVGTVGAPRPLNVTVDQAAYRILQEALTNASRHGSGSADIELAFGEAALELTVSNPVPADRSTTPSGGHGLVGMRERATLVGGSIEEERGDGTFRLGALLWYRGRRP